MQMLLPAGFVLVCCLAWLWGRKYEREAAKSAKALLEDVATRMVAVRNDVYLRGDLSDIPRLRDDALRLIQDCIDIAQEESPIERDQKIKEMRIASRADDIEARLRQVPPVEGE